MAPLRHLMAPLAALMPALALSTLLVPYSVGVAHGTLRPLLPTISETGLCPATAALFTWLATTTAAAGACCTLGLYTLLQSRGEPAPRCHLLLVLGLSCAVAVALAARTPMNQYLLVHLAAVVVLATAGGGLCLLLAVLTPRSQPWLRWLRCALLGAMICMCTAMFGASQVAPDGYLQLQLQAFDACNATVVEQLGWRPGSRLFNIQLVVAGGEWASLTLFSVFLASFAGDLWQRSKAEEDNYIQLS